MTIDDSYRHVEKPKAKPSEYDNASQDTRQKPKAEKSDFDRILEQSKLTQPQNPVKPKAEVIQQQSVEEIIKNRDKEDDSKKDDSEDRSGKKKESGERKDSQGLTEGRVHGKGSKQEGGGGGSGRDGFYSGHDKKAAFDKVKDSSKTKVSKDGLQARFAAELKTLMKEADVRVPKALNQELLNQIVKFVRIGINTKGEKEFLMSFHEKVFRGLRLRVTEKNGKVGVHFSAPNSAVKGLFEKEAEKIKSTLLAKGIDVDEVTVG